MKSRVLYYFALFLLAYMPIFHQLGEPPIKAWDESLYAMRAYHMAETGQYLDNFDQFPGITHYPNLKPPLGTIIQSLAFKTFGYNAWSLRLPIALCTLSILVIFFEFLYKLSSSFWPGFFACVILLSSWGFFREHIARTGDHDVFYVFFLLIQLIAFFQYLRNGFLNHHLVLFTLATLGAFFTKSIMAFFLFPGFVLYALLSKKLFRLIRQRNVYLFGGICLFIIAIYYTLMNFLFPNFFQMILDTVWGRYLTTIENHQLPWYFYLEQFIKKGLFPWTLLLPFALFVNHPKMKNFSVYLWVALISFMVVISLSQTKLYWYDALLYPIGALLIGITLYDLIAKLKGNPNLKWLIPSLAVVFFISGYTLVFHHNINQKWQEEPDQYGYLMQQLKAEKGYTVYGYEYNVQAAFYAKLFRDKDQQKVDVITYFGQKKHQSGDLILVCDPEKLKKVGEEFEFTTIRKEDQCQLLRLDNRQN